PAGTFRNENFPSAPEIAEYGGMAPPPGATTFRTVSSRSAPAMGSFVPSFTTVPSTEAVPVGDRCVTEVGFCKSSASRTNRNTFITATPLMEVNTQDPAKMFRYTVDRYSY